MQNMVVTVEESGAQFPLPPRLSDDIFSTKAKQQRKTTFSSSGHEGEIATPPPHMAVVAPEGVALAPGQPVRRAGSGAVSLGQPRASAGLSPPPESPARTLLSVPFWGKICRLQTPLFP